MADRAIVIGIDDYQRPEWRLGSSVADALAFAHWLTGPGGVPGANVHLLLSPEPAPSKLPPGVTRRGGGTSQEIADLIADLQSLDPTEGGERLYFYYAGHAGLLPHWRPEPLLIPADFVDERRHGQRLIGFSQVVPALAGAPFGEQLFFIDACRDFALPDYAPPIQSTVGAYSVVHGSRQYVLYSVAPGQRAAATGNGIWTETLLEGLGRRAYQVVSLRQVRGVPRYEVRLDRLAEWVRREVEAKIARRFQRDAARYVQMPQYAPDLQGGDPLLISFTEQTVPNARVEVLVEPDLAHAACELAVLQYVPGLRREVAIELKGPPIELITRFELPPADYSFRAQCPQYTLRRQPWTPEDPPVVELKLEQEPLVRFSSPSTLGEGWTIPEMRVPILEGEPGGTRDWGDTEPTPGTKGQLSVYVPDRQIQVEVLDWERNVVGQARGGLMAKLEPGIYRVRLRLPEVQPMEQAVEIRAGAMSDVRLEMPEARLGRLHLSLLENLGVDVVLKPDRGEPEQAERKVQFLFPSEALGPIAGARLGSLLAYAAYAANLPDQGDFGKLRGFGIQPFDESSGSAGVLALVGLGAERELPEIEEFLTGAELSLCRRRGEVPLEGRFTALPGMPAAAQFQIPVDLPGSLQAELRLRGFGTTRYALTTLPERLTVLIAVLEQDGSVDVQQFLFPLPKRPQPGRRYFQDSLQNLRRMDLAQRYYASGEALRGFDDEGLRDLLWGKWLDPLMGCIAGYCLVRAGKAGEFAEPEPYGGPDILRHLEDPADPVAAEVRSTEPGPSALRNMAAFFPTLPDVHVLAGLCEPDPALKARHFKRALRYGLPLFGEGTRALADWFLRQQGEPPHEAPGRSVLPEPLREAMASLLSGSPWTAWAAPAAGGRV